MKTGKPPCIKVQISRPLFLEWLQEWMISPSALRYVCTGVTRQLNAKDPHQRILGTSTPPTVALHVLRAQEVDSIFINNFFATVDRASPMPGGFSRAFQNKDINQLDALATQVFQEQTEVCALSSKGL
jgi:hypothetical protein